MDDFTEHNQYDYYDMLPSDDQLDKFVENLCENFTSLNLMKDSHLENVNEANTNNSTHSDLNDSKVASSNIIDNINETYGFCSSSTNTKNISSEKLLDATFYKSMEYPVFEKSKSFSKKRTLHSKLNAVIAQCSSSLELLMDKRKNLELLVKMQQKVSSIDYNIYTPRLPDTPSKVDRLMFDVNQERYRVLGLLSVLEKTIQSFSSKNVKNNFRELLNVYGNAISDVIKERAREAASLNKNVPVRNDSGMSNLIELITRVHRMNYSVHTALWCVEIKEQVVNIMNIKSI